MKCETSALLIERMIFVSRKGAKAQRARVGKVEFYDFISHLCNAETSFSLLPSALCLLPSLKPI
ncbi:hypothetical protein NIES21_01580 [Anabaenopsis circularis NIES-21]|uniref:Uncharacterized protein n=1 Tax=Anabaenopsis circularis NIES-21 TaxID=1085406 RepID=A0A1Z4GA75_9CYAN|nr:hypothetical protein NIES21_01580 [Anabaenopsis circularis NIES-21]